MNDAHLHMVVNHFPIIGLFFGIGILAFGIIKKQTILVKTAYIIFIFCMIMAQISMMTGERAEEIVEELGISHNIIHEHEEKAETFIKIMYVLGLFSILGLVSQLKKHTKATVISYIVLVIAIISAVVSSTVGTSGGEIRHTEIRQNTTQTVDSSKTAEVEDKD